MPSPGNAPGIGLEGLLMLRMRVGGGNGLAGLLLLRIRVGTGDGLVDLLSLRIRTAPGIGLVGLLWLRKPVGAGIGLVDLLLLRTRTAPGIGLVGLLELPGGGGGGKGALGGGAGGPNPTTGMPRSSAGRLDRVFRPLNPLCCVKLFLLGGRTSRGEAAREGSGVALSSLSLTVACDVLWNGSVGDVASANVVMLVADLLGFRPRMGAVKLRPAALPVTEFRTDERKGA